MSRVRTSSRPLSLDRRLPVGADIQRSGGVHFRVWAPRSSTVSVELGSKAAKGSEPLESEGNGYFSGLVGSAAAGSQYRFRLDNGAFPDPASRFQPEGPHGPSQIIDPGSFRWTDRRLARRRRSKARSFMKCTSAPSRREGTWAAAVEQLPELADSGSHRARSDAGGRFPGPFRLGLRRRGSVCAHAALRNARRVSRFRRSRARARASASFWTSSTIISAPMEII